MKNNKIISTNNSNLYLLPLFFLIVVIPLMVHGKIVELEGMRNIYWNGQNQYFDIFTYWKSFYIQVITAVMFLLYAYSIYRKKFSVRLCKKMIIPLIILAIEIIISTFMSIDRETALLGFPDMSQSIFVLLGYLMIIVYTSEIIGNEIQVKLLMKSLAILTIIEGILGVTQYFGNDFFRTAFGENLIMPANVYLENGLKFSFGPKAIYATMFNTNFVGSFTVLVIPIMFCMLTISKKLKDKILYSIAMVYGLFLWFGCNSRAGYVGMSFCIITFLVFMRKVIVKNWKRFLIVLFVSVLAFAGLNKISDGKFFRQIKTLNVFSEEVTSQFGYKDEFYLEDIIVEGNVLKIKSNKEEIVINYNMDNVSIFNGNNEKMLLLESKDEYYKIMNGEVASNFSIKLIKEYPSFLIKTVEGSVVKFFLTDEIKIITNTGNLLPVKKYDYVEFLDERGKMASGRGYIWSRSIPLIKNYIFYGAGPDNFIYAFPQGDVLGKINVMPAQMNIVVDKPHNMYIQMAINTGLISLLAFLALILIYMASVIKSMWKSNFDYVMDKVNVAILISIVGYIAAGMFNDQINSVAPIFYVLLGLGIAVNRLCLVEQRRQKYMSKK